MPLYYFDSSALVKYYVREPGSAWVRNLVDGMPVQPVFMADISVTELAAAFAILQRTGRIGRGTWARAYDELMNDTNRRYDLVRTSLTDFFNAAELTRQYPLRAYDAVQLAVAQRQSQTVSVRHLSLILVSGDSILLTAAQAEGLFTANPFDHIAPEDSAKASL